MSFKKSIIIVLLLCSCVPVILSAGYFNLIYTKTLQEDLENSMITNIAFSRENTEQNMRYLEDTYMRVIADDSINQGLYSYKQSTDPMERNQIQSSMTTEIQNILNFSSSWREKVIDTFFVFMNEEDYVGVIRHSDQKILIEEHKDIYKNRLDGQWTNDYFLSDVNKDILYFTRDIYELEGFQPIGQLVMGINVVSLVHSDASNSYLENNIQLVFNKSGDILFSSLPLEQLPQSIYTHRNNSTIFKTLISGQEYFVGISNFEYYDYYTAILVPVEGLQIKQQVLSRNFTLIILAMGALSIIIGLLFSNHIIKPLSLIAKHCKDSFHDHVMSPLPDFNFLEFNNISLAFNSMLKRMDHLVNQVYRKQMLLQESEMKMLQSQVNPHFIFNILDTIAWEALAQNQKDIYKMVNSLADIMRNNMLYANVETITVEQEMNYVRDYVFLQKVRFEDRLEVSITMDQEDINKLYIPKLCIQPFVDNAIVHGIEGKEETGHLHIILSLEDNTLVCTVTDDGIGYDETPTPSTGHHTGTGIHNVNKRIHLRYGEEYGAEVTSQKNIGTKVTLRLPKDEGGQDHV